MFKIMLSGLCEVQELLQSTAIHHHSQGASPPTGRVWRKVAELLASQSALVSLQGQLFAVGGYVTCPSDETSAVHQYDTIINSWKVISHMHEEQRLFHFCRCPPQRPTVCSGRERTKRNSISYFSHLLCVCRIFHLVDTV